MYRSRRRWNVAVLILLSAAVGLVALVGAAAGDQERVASDFTVAVVHPDGSARITEVIDYDFGTGSHHGIYRTIPGLGTDAAIQVQSPDAPDQWTIDARGIRIGDPNRTISGRRRYRIDYTLHGVAPNGRLAWNALGTDWQVGVEHIEAHVLAPWRFDTIRCDRGKPGATGGCTATEVSPGHLRLVADSIPNHEGITVSAIGTTRLAAAPAAPGVPPPAPDHTAGLAKPAALAALAALVAMFATMMALRRAGRDEVLAGGAADAAFATHAPPPPPPSVAPVDPVDPASAGAPGAPGAAPGAMPLGTAGGTVERLDTDALADLTTVEFAPPPDLTPAEGGILLTERVRAEHKLAWLVDQAAHGAVDLEATDKKQVTLRWRGEYGATGNPVLLRMFDGRTDVELGKYDRDFSKSWKLLGDQLEAWRRGSPLWSAAAERRRGRVLVLGVVLCVAAAAALFVGGLLTGTRGPGYLALVVVAALAAGAAVPMVVCSWELRVRTVRGSALWLRTESFRRFIAQSEAQHADWAAEHGILREYTSWAIALGEIEHWSRAVDASATARTADPAGFYLATTAPRLLSVTSAAATAPSSSGGGFGGGFSGVGGGAGGGGGGSW